MSDPPCLSLYRALDPVIHEIRLLTTFAIDDEDRVTCRLITVPLHDCPAYTALSYVWGKATDPVPIQVDCKDFQATASLASALRCIPRHWQSRYPSRALTELRVWADAVCINQHDLAERAQQVQLMDGIYSGAELVMCWMPDGIRQPLDPRPFSDDIQDDLLSIAFRTLELINRELRLVEQEAGGTLWDITLDDERLVNWLAKCPELSESIPDKYWPYWTNRNWKAVRHFSGLQYWQRVWIFQEVVLAQEALLICKSSCISLTETVDRVLRWFDLLELCDLETPGFISSGLWQSLISGSGLSGLKLTGHIDAWRRRRMQIHTLSWRLFYTAGSLSATNPKDHVYGLLGVTGIDIRADYSEQTSVAKVFHDVTAAWLRDYASKKEDLGSQAAVSGMKELWFLSLAGLRRGCSHVSCQHFSSWAPNFPHFHHNRSDYVMFTKVNADYGVFSEEERLKISHIQGSSLFVTGVIIDSVHETYPQVIKSSDIFGFISGLFWNNVYDFLALRPRRRLLRDLFELLCWGDLPNSVLNTRLHISDPGSFEYLASACAFVWVVLRGGFQYRTAIERLGLRSDTETGFWRSLRATFLDLEEGSEEDCGEESGSDLDNNSTSWLQDLVDSEATGQMPKEGTLADYCQRMVINIETGSLDDCSLFRTSRGLIGLASRKTIVRRDSVCVLKGYDSVASLRENGDHFLYVGDTKVQGMMEGQAVELLKEGVAEVRQFELR
ncbi:hypothetical protein VPNG_05002 [Cytospora leucostoma]|uniref:Heterokaryon incompatibility domain-containing protein n=1 Tax=Cytospora leucostoma TaxID=1230097 RepID=A0A423X802_9PEZI|nr:hypothetical protein VPNG_05002 [Cytospora leucostoma]